MSRTHGHDHRRYTGEKYWHATKATRRDTRRSKDPVREDNLGEDVMSLAHRNEGTP